ncbi:unnamed protein product [Cunninghamella blakesleeana]
MANKKIEMDNVQDFIHVMNNVISNYKESTKNICEEDNISPKNQERIQTEIDSWVKDLIKMVGSNISIQGEDINTEALLREPDDDNLAIEEKRLELQARETLAKVLHKRKDVSSELMPMLEEIEKIKSYQVDNITFSDLIENTNKDENIPDIKEMETEYEDSMKLVSELQKNIPRTKEKLKNYEDLLNTERSK